MADKVAYCEDVDSEDEALSETKAYARSVVAPSPTKERSNTGRSRKSGSRHSPASPSSYDDDLSDTPGPASRREGKRPKDPSKRSSRSGPVVVSKQSAPKRPGVRQSKTTGHIPGRSIDESSYYGVQSHPQTIVSRPRSKTRPESYYGQTARQAHRGGPPMANSAFFNGPHGQHGPPPGAPFGAQPFAPPGMYGGGPPHHMNLPMHGGPPGPPGPQGPPHAMDYPGAPPRDMPGRFGRPQSSMGFRPSFEPESGFEKQMARKPSVSRKISNHHDDRMRMPPPARPSSARPSQSGGERLVFKPDVFKPPPPQAMTKRRKSRPVLDEDFDDENFEEDDVLYRPDARRPSHGHGALAHLRHPFQSQRRDSMDHESDLDLAIYKKEPVASARRKSSIYSGGHLDDKARKAMNYQDSMMGHGAPLTAESLRKVKNGGSSRSTRSTESRDESDWKHSATTRTTRSSNEEDDVTIKLPKGGVIEVAGAKITCAAGGDVSIGRGNRGNDNATERDTETVHDDEDSEESEEEEDEEDEEDYEEDMRAYSRRPRGSRSQKRIQAEPHVGSYPRRGSRLLMHPGAPALQHPAYQNYAPSSHMTGRRTPGPPGAQQHTSVYEPFPYDHHQYAPTFNDEDEEDDEYYPPQRGGRYHAGQPYY